jgi:hypothetical protein
VSKTLKATISNISKSALVTILFSQDLNSDAKQNLSAINKTVLHLSVKPSSENIQQHRFTWECMSLSKWMMKLQIRFEDPLVVSRMVIVLH